MASHACRTEAGMHASRCCYPKKPACLAEMHGDPTELALAATERGTDRTVPLVIGTSNDDVACSSRSGGTHNQRRSLAELVRLATSSSTSLRCPIRPPSHSIPLHVPRPDPDVRGRLFPVSRGLAFDRAPHHSLTARRKRGPHTRSQAGGRATRTSASRPFPESLLPPSFPLTHQSSHIRRGASPRDSRPESSSRERRQGTTPRHATPASFPRRSPLL
jgi:hypothetical protein